MATMKRTLAGSLIGVAAILAAAQAQAEEYSLAPGDWLVRLRGVMIDTNKMYKDVSGVAGADAEVHHAQVPELDFTYMITKNWGAELILATSEQDIHGHEGAIEDTNVGSVGVLPPTLTLQYHFDQLGAFRPYFGVGINYTHFYNEDTAGDFKRAVGLAGPNTKLKLDDSWGYALQVGGDMYFNKDWFFNLDLKYIDIDTELKIRGADAAVLNGDTSINLDPLVFGIGVGRRF